MLAKASSFFFFLSFLLLFLVSLSIPIIKSLDLFKLSADASSSLLKSHASASVSFGVWGYCTSGADVEVVGIDHDTAGQCSKPKLGYTFDSTVADALHVSAIADAISHTLSAALVLHVIDCILALLALVASVRTWLASAPRFEPNSRVWFLVTLGVALFAAFLTTVTFIIDLVFSGIVSSKISDEADGVVRLTRGNAIWMTVASAVLLWVGISFACMDMCRGRRHSKSASRY